MSWPQLVRTFMRAKSHFMIASIGTPMSFSLINCGWSPQFISEKPFYDRQHWHPYELFADKLWLVTTVYQRKAILWSPALAPLWHPIIYPILRVDDHLPHSSDGYPMILALGTGHREEAAEVWVELLRAARAFEPLVERREPRLDINNFFSAPTYMYCATRCSFKSHGFLPKR